MVLSRTNVEPTTLARISTLQITCCDAMDRGVLRSHSGTHNVHRHKDAGGSMAKGIYRCWLMPGHDHEQHNRETILDRIFLEVFGRTGR
jgi:hypothetical protein